MKNSENAKILALTLLFGTGLAACKSAPDDGMDDSIPSYEQLQLVAPRGGNGAIYKADTALALYEDAKARRIGDILTIVLVEETSGQNSMDNSINSSTELNLDTPIIGGLNKPDFNYNVGGGSSFEGQSGSSQSNRLSGSIAVTVHAVLPNGNLVVEGEKWIRINQANEYVKLEGVVRPIDIGAFNTLYSTQVADARITYAGKGANSHSNSPGWVSRIIFSPLWPF
ncbi:MAG: flagellar basal body L-ring protein FlgH [Gammaproteobacteria bacterium]|nr:flagellar basal body L-ring protein FlgH [Pseudomonadales bacterium]MCP5349023.1 flagellar basal body L-ring protein FlgH [Pseudomonadales bacterium]